MPDNDLRRLSCPGTKSALGCMQRSDSPELSDVLDLFPVRYHEPYYKSYARDDLAALMSESGFEVESEGSHFVSKVVAGRRP